MRRLCVRSVRGLLAEPVRDDLAGQVDRLTRLTAEWPDRTWQIEESDR